MRKKKTKVKPITANTPLSEIVTKYPVLAQVLEEEFELHCLNCPLSSLETLAEGARAHGYTDEDIAEIVDYLNRIIDYAENGTQ